MEEAKVHTAEIISLFKTYIKAFSEYKLDDVVACYHLPCTLHTPDKVVLLNNIQESQQVFNDIFSQLKHAKIAKINASNASYSLVSDTVIIASVDWAFIDEQGNIFTDFCAIYHLVLMNNELKIVNVVSHESANSLSLNFHVNLAE